MKSVRVHPPRQVHKAITINGEVDVVMVVIDVVRFERRLESLPSRFPKRSPSNDYSLMGWIIVVRALPVVSSELLIANGVEVVCDVCLLYTSPSPRDRQKSRMPSSA